MLHRHARKIISNSAALMMFGCQRTRTRPAILKQRGDTHSKIEQKHTQSVRKANNIDKKQYVGGGAHAQRGGSDININKRVALPSRLIVEL